jgi:MFS family permease
MVTQLAPDADAAPTAEAPTIVPASRRREILLWGGALLLLANLAAPGFGLITLPITFFLKNKLHLQSHQLAIFNLWTGAPLYLGFVFGLLRDRWSPLRAGDRGHLVIFGVASAAIFAAIAFLPPTYAVLFVGVFLVTMSLMMVASATNGLVSTIGQQHVMAGQVSVAFLLANAVPTVASYLLGGTLSQILEGQKAVAAARALFLIAAALMLAIALFGARGPKALFGAAHAEHPARASVVADIRRLLAWWPVWPALIIQMLWQFGPALGLAMQYHLANTLHATDGQVGLFYAIFYACLIPTYALYGWLCQRVKLSTLLWWGAATSVPQMFPLLFIHSAAGALLAAVPVGLMGGFATAAYIDLAIRSCPKGLQGTMMMLITSTAYWIAVRFGDLWGTDLYDHHGGFRTAVFATIGVYALIVPLLLLIPKRLISTSDGEAPGP